MQSLWSRVGCICRCVRCLPAPAAVSRATTTASGKIIRPIPSSTIFYSAIFAAAAVADGEVKQKRREQWDTAIAKAKLELELVSDELEGVPGSWEVLGEYSLDPGAPRPEWPVNLGLPLNPHHLSPQSLWSSDWLREMALDFRYTDKKINLCSLSMTKLVMKMLLEAKMYGLSPEEVVNLPPLIQPLATLEKKQLEYFHWKTRKNVKRSHLTPVSEPPPESKCRIPESDCSLKYPQYFQDDNGSFLLENKKLNTALRNLIRKHREGVISFQTLVARICHNLLATTAPPSIQTYNILLLGMQSKNPRIFDAIVRSLVETRVRPNEVTCSSILWNYINRDEYEKFSHFIGLMRGLDGGLMLARPDVPITPRWRGLLVPHPEGSEKLILKVAPTPPVFEAVIAGVLKFGGLNAAIHVVETLAADFWGIDSRGLERLLEACISDKDWDTGFKIWAQVRELNHRSKKRIRFRAYATMMRLSLVCGRKDFYDELNWEASRVHGWRGTNEADMRAKIKQLETPTNTFDHSSNWTTPEETEETEASTKAHSKQHTGHSAIKGAIVSQETKIGMPSTQPSSKSHTPCYQGKTFDKHGASWGGLLISPMISSGRGNIVEASA